MTAALQDPAQTDTARSIFALLMRDHPSSQEQGKNQLQSLRRTLGRLSGDRPEKAACGSFCQASASSDFPAFAAPRRAQKVQKISEMSISTACITCDKATTGKD